ncbi:MAG: hypothetical protein AAGN46_14270 [Acidobacteriota bacterium]
MIWRSQTLSALLVIALAMACGLSVFDQLSPGHHIHASDEGHHHHLHFGPHGHDEDHGHGHEPESEHRDTDPASEAPDGPSRSDDGESTATLVASVELTQPLSFDTAPRAPPAAIGPIDPRDRSAPVRRVRNAHGPRPPPVASLLRFAD